MTISEAKAELEKQQEIANKIWEESKPARDAQDKALEPWHLANRKINGLKGIIALLEESSTIV